MYIENLLKVLKEQDEILKMSLDLKLIHFEPLVETVEKLVKELLEIKKKKLLVSIQVQEKQLFIDKELLIRMLVNLKIMLSIFHTLTVKFI